MTLRQAIGVIMGANIGTTVTAFIIGFNIGEYALPIMALGSFMLFFFKHQKINVFGQAIFGLGSLFFGLKLMGNGMAPISSLDFFHELTLIMSDNLILELLIVIVFILVVEIFFVSIIIFGQFIFGLVSLFFELKLMGNGMSPISSLDFFHELTLSMSDNPILGLVIGTVFTLVVQSSSATIGILQGLYAESAITLKAAL